MATDMREPRAYELMTILIPDLSEEDTGTHLDRVGTYITDAGGTISERLTDSPWGRRRLAYSIRFNSQDYRDGFYAVYHFDMAPSAVIDVERELKLDTSVIRYLVVHDDPLAGEQTPNEPAAEEFTAEPTAAGTPVVPPADTVDSDEPGAEPAPVGTMETPMSVTDSAAAEAQSVASETDATSGDTVAAADVTETPAAEAPTEPEAPGDMAPTTAEAPTEVETESEGESPAADTAEETSEDTPAESKQEG